MKKLIFVFAVSSHTMKKLDYKVERDIPEDSPEVIAESIAQIKEELFESFNAVKYQRIEA